MTRWTTTRAKAIGITVLILAQVLYLGVLLKVEHHELLRVMLLFSPGIAAFATAYLAPNRKVLAGSSMAVWGAGISMVSSVAYEMLGLLLDSIGGPLATFAIILAYYAVLSIVGSVAGHILSRDKTAKPNTIVSNGGG